jgi:hypothetical protein
MLGGAIFAMLLIVAIAYLAATAAPIRPLQAVQPFGQRIAPDSRVMQMVHRAQLDYIVRPAPEVRRTLLILCEARSDGDQFDLVFDPAGQLDIFVSYRFSRDGKMLWKQAYG